MTHPTPSEIAKQIESLINEWSEIDCGAATQYSFPTTEIEMLLSKHLTASAADAAEIERLRAELAEETHNKDTAVSLHGQVVQLMRESDSELAQLREQVKQLTADIAEKAEAAAKEIAQHEDDAWERGEAGGSISVRKMTAIITRIFEGRSE